MVKMEKNPIEFLNKSFIRTSVQIRQILIISRGGETLYFICRFFISFIIISIYNIYKKYTNIYKVFYFIMYCGTRGYLRRRTDGFSPSDDVWRPGPSSGIFASKSL